MAIAVNGGHVARALDFYDSIGKYFIIGGTSVWSSGGIEDDSTPNIPSSSDFKLNGILGLKKIDNINLVIPDDNGTIQYRNQNWKIITRSISTTVGSTGVTSGSNVVPVVSVAGMTVGSKLRINNLYEGTITGISGLLVTLDTNAPSAVTGGSPVIGGAMVEGAKYVYVDCYLNYDEFPLGTYRQIGLCSGVTPNTADVLRPAGVDGRTSNEYSSLGILEILDNRVPAPRDVSQRELLSLIIEF